MQAEPLTAEGFRPFGQVIGLDDVRIELRGDEEFHLDIISYDRKPIRASVLNRHHNATQALVALDAKPTVIIVAPPEVDFSSAGPPRHPARVRLRRLARHQPRAAHMARGPVPARAPRRPGQRAGQARARERQRGRPPRARPRRRRRRRPLTDGRPHHAGPLSGDDRRRRRQAYEQRARAAGARARRRATGDLVGERRARPHRPPPRARRVLAARPVRGGRHVPRARRRGRGPWHPLPPVPAARPRAA